MINTELVQVQADELSLFSDDESVGSIFSSSDEEEEDMMAPTLIPQDLDSDFKRRDELMDQLVKDIEPKYALAMKKIEQVFRKQKMNDISGTKLDDKTARTSISTHSSSSTTTLENQDSAYSHIGWMERVEQWLPLGTIFRLQGLVILLLNCVAYNAGTPGKVSRFYKFHVYSRVFSFAFCVSQVKTSFGPWSSSCQAAM